MMRWGAGTLLAASIALGAYRAGALTRDGALAAWATGTLTFGTGGVRTAVVLLAFFIPSTLLSRIGGDRKRAAMADAKTGPRDGRQVLANGGIAAACLLGGSSRAAAAFAGALAAASADTWGTEIGTASREQPRSIVTFEPAAAGMSGGVTALGSVASVAGSACVAAAASATGVTAFWPVAIAGVAGALADSLLGATVQERRWCPRCELGCETDPHACGSPTEHRSGFAWLSNDAVNLAATLTGAAIAAALAR